MNKNTLKFLAGAATGIAAGVAIDRYLESESGKKTKEMTKKKLMEFYNFAIPRLKGLKGGEKERYKEAIISAAIEYGKMKKISDKAVDDLVKKTLAFWDEFLDEK